MLEPTCTDATAINAAYHTHIHENCIALYEGRLIIFQPVQSGYTLSLIVVPESLRSDPFSAFHASSSCRYFKLHDPAIFALDLDLFTLDLDLFAFNLLASISVSPSLSISTSSS